MCSSERSFRPTGPRSNLATAAAPPGNPAAHRDSPRGSSGRRAHLAARSSRTIGGHGGASVKRTTPGTSVALAAAAVARLLVHAGGCRGLPACANSAYVVTDGGAAGLGVRSRCRPSPRPRRSGAPPPAGRGCQSVPSSRSWQRTVADQPVTPTRRTKPVSAEHVLGGERPSSGSRSHGSGARPFCMEGEVLAEARARLGQPTTAAETSPRADGAGRRGARSGRRSAVRRTACSWRHAAIAAWSPDSSTGGTSWPRQVAGLV